MKTLFIILLSAITALSSWAQVIPDEITLVDRPLVGYECYQGPMQIGHNRIKVLMEDCPKALEFYEKGKRFESLSILFIVMGTVIAGAGLGNYHFSGQEESPYPFLIPGIALIGFGIPIYFQGKKNIRSGLKIYNTKCIRN